MDWNVELVPYLSTVVLVATVATVILAIFSYAAFKLREQRRPRAEDAEPVFFRRYRPGSEPAVPAPEEDPS